MSSTHPSVLDEPAACTGPISETALIEQWLDKFNAALQSENAGARLQVEHG